MKEESATIGSSGAGCVDLLSVQCPAVIRERNDSTVAEEELTHSVLRSTDS